MRDYVSTQTAEIELRERVAAEHYDNYLEALSASHSIPVMDHEVDRFLAAIPQGGLVLDIGGCWGWHWRRLAHTRPDVGVLIVDLVRSNLPHARNVLGSLVGRQVELMHAARLHCRSARTRASRALMASGPYRRSSTSPTSTKQCRKYIGC